MSDAIERAAISEHADLLNALHEMQGSLAYAVRRSTLADAESLIVSQEQEIVKLREAASNEFSRGFMSGQTNGFELGQRSRR